MGWKVQWVGGEELEAGREYVSKHQDWLQSTRYLKVKLRSSDLIMQKNDEILKSFEQIPS